MTESSNSSKYIIIILIVCSFYSQSISVGYLPLLSIFSKQFFSSHNNAQYIVTVYLSGFATSQLFAGVLADKFGRKRIFLCGIILSFFGLLSCNQSQTALLLFLSFYLQSFGVGFIIPIQNVIVADTHQEKESRIAYGFINVSLCLGGVFSPLFSSVFTAKFTWKYYYLFLILFSLLVFIIAIIFLPETKKNTTNINLKKYYKGLFDKIFNFKGKPILTSVVIISSSLVAITATFNTFAPIVLTKFFNLDIYQVGKIFSMCNIINVAGLLSSFLLSNIRKNSSILISSCLITIPIILICPITYLYLNHSLPMVIFLYSYYAIIFLIGLATPSVWIIALNHSEYSSAQVAALMILWQNIFSVVLSAAVAHIEEQSRFHAPIYLIFMVLTLMSLVRANTLRKINL